MDRAMNTFIFTVRLEWENEAGESVTKRFDSVEEAMAYVVRSEELILRCNCENSHCAVVHELADCQSEATIGCKWIGQICEPCSAYMPAHYLTGAIL